MKGLLKRDSYNFFRPGMIIALLGTIFLLYYVGVISPLGIFNDYVPTKIEHDTLFNRYTRNTSLDRAINYLLRLNLVTYEICIAFIAFLAWSIIRKDAESRWNMYLAVTPVKRRTYVIEKYILVFCAVVFLSIPLPVSSVIYNNIESKFDKGFSLISFDVAKEYILSLVFMQAVVLIAMSTLLPLLFLLWSRNKVGVFFITCGFVVQQAVLGVPAFFSNVSYASTMHPVIAIILFIISLGLFILSCWGSIKICKKRQF